jgi:hypothetical protein
MIKFDVEFSVYESGRKKPQYTVDADINGQLTLAELFNLMRTTIVSTANEVLKEEQAAGFDKNPVVAVDGKIGVPATAVQPFGTIDITARQDMRAIIMETYQGILDRSPVDTGRYKGSNVVLWNSKVVAENMAELQAWLSTNPKFEDKDFINFINSQPYARKLERQGITIQRRKERTVKSRDRRRAARGIRMLAPNGVYFLTWRQIRAKYKRNSIIRFTFISGATLGLSGRFTANARERQKGMTHGRHYLYPSIVISVQERGTV